MKTLAAIDRDVPACRVMSLNPVSVRETATIRDTAAFLLAKRVSAAPVINEAGRAVGVVALSDVVRKLIDEDDAALEAPVGDVMNDAVFFVRPTTPLGNVIDDLRDCGVKRLFVADEDDVIVGVISAVDLLRYVAAPEASRPATRTRRQFAAWMPEQATSFAWTGRAGSYVTSVTSM